MTSALWNSSPFSYYLRSGLYGFAFPLRRRCLDQFCQYICDRESSNTYKFRLVKPCPEGCICKPYLSYVPYYYEPYDAECCPATYGLTFTIACIDDGDPLINFYCPPHVETCQVKILDEIPTWYGVRLRRIAVRNSCLLSRLGPDVNWTYGLMSSEYILANGQACVCNLLANSFAYRGSGVIAQGDHVILTIECYDNYDSYWLKYRALSGPCFLCNVPIGTTVESLCAYHEITNQLIDIF
jgi:hypothetical protein